MILYFELWIVANNGDLKIRQIGPTTFKISLFTEES